MRRKRFFISCNNTTPIDSIQKSYVHNSKYQLLGIIYIYIIISEIGMGLSKRLELKMFTVL